MSTLDSDLPVELLALLEAATRDLLYISESDAPLHPFLWPGAAPLTAEIVKQKAGLPAEALVEEQGVDEFFAPVATAESWMNADEKAEAQRFGELRRLLETQLTNLKVFRASESGSETKFRVFVVGQTAGGYAGVETAVVET